MREVTSIRLSQAERDWLKVQAKLEGVTPAEVMRKAIDAYKTRDLVALPIESDGNGFVIRISRELVKT